MIEKDIQTIQIISDRVDLIWPNIKNKFIWESYKNVSINVVALGIILFLTTPATLIHFISIDK